MSRVTGCLPTDGLSESACVSGVGKELIVGVYSHGLNVATNTGQEEGAGAGSRPGVCRGRDRSEVREADKGQRLQ